MKYIYVCVLVGCFSLIYVLYGLLMFLSLFQDFHRSRGGSQTKVFLSSIRKFWHSFEPRRSTSSQRKQRSLNLQRISVQVSCSLGESYKLYAKRDTSSAASAPNQAKTSSVSASEWLLISYCRGVCVCLGLMGLTIRSILNALAGKFSEEVWKKSKGAKTKSFSTYAKFFIFSNLVS